MRVCSVLYTKRTKQGKWHCFYIAMFLSLAQKATKNQTKQIELQGFLDVRKMNKEMTNANNLLNEKFHKILDK